MPDFTCRDCGAAFTVADAVMARYPNWTPRQCLDCRGGRGSAARGRLAGAPSASVVLSGPQTGIFTDGCCEPNPGPGGWGAVKVLDSIVIEERDGHEAATTNNRMELRALIEGYRLVAVDEALTVFSDSEYSVKTVTLWAAGWQRKGWRTSSGPVKNLDLVQELFALAQSRPRAKLEWIRGHAGSTWNEYADALSRKWLADQA